MEIKIFSPPKWTEEYIFGQINSPDITTTQIWLHFDIIIMIFENLEKFKNSFKNKRGLVVLQPTNHHRNGNKNF